jgi:hypothetical protein
VWVWAGVAAVVAFRAIIISAVGPLAMTSTNAADLKLDAPCASLNTLDVTKVDNPQCKALSAIYIGADGKMLCLERLRLDREQLVTGRLVRVVKSCEQNSPNCPGGCGKPAASCALEAVADAHAEQHA